MKVSKHFISAKGMVVVKKYRDKYKITYHKNLRLQGFEQVEEEYSNEYIEPFPYDIDNVNVYFDDLTGETFYDFDVSEKIKDKVKEVDYEEQKGKLANNLCRAKSTIYELALCNDWDFFCTFTLDKTKYDRYDLEKFHKDFSQKIRNLNKKYNCKIDFLLIPEQHKDGAWHMHGFIKGLPECELRQFGREEHLPLYILEKVINNQPIYSWISYEKKFGFCDLEPIQNIYKASAYITKYVAKSLNESITDLHSHTYYASKGLKRAEKVNQGYLYNASDFPMLFEFQNDYVKVHWADEEEYNNIKDFIDKY